MVDHRLQLRVWRPARRRAWQRIGTRRTRWGTEGGVPAFPGRSEVVRSGGNAGLTRHVEGREAPGFNSCTVKSIQRLKRRCLLGERCSPCRLLRRLGGERSCRGLVSAEGNVTIIPVAVALEVCEDGNVVVELEVCEELAV